MLLRLAAGIGFLALTSSTAFAGTIEGPLEIIVSRDMQSLKVFDGGTLVASSNVSSGMDGYTTPTGIFSILEKKRMHHSNIYDEAPMPFMQRLTWSGIALHASDHVPPYPASHGCVRMPGNFAKMLFKMTSRGGHVLITGREVEPRPIEHPALFRPRLESSDALLSDAMLRPTIPNADKGNVEIAMSVPKPPETAARKLPENPVRILITRRTDTDTLKDVQSLLNVLGFDAGVPDGLQGTMTIAAIRAFQESEGMKVDGTFTPALSEAVFRKAGRGLPPNGKLFVRRNFEPILEGPVTINEPQLALGTHFLLARDADLETGSIDWYGVTMDNDLPSSTRRRLGITDPGLIEISTAQDPIAVAMDRFVISDDLRRQVDTLIGEGASVTISDSGYEQETGKGTDFITLTRANGYGSTYVPSSTPRKKESSLVVIE